MELKCVIIDEDVKSVENLKNHLSNFSKVKVLGKFSNPIDALELIEAEKVILVFIEIKHSKINGLDFIKNTYLKTNFVITTKLKYYACEGFDLNVFDYLIKPIQLSRLLKTINRLNQKIYLEDNKLSLNNVFIKNHIFLKVNKALVKIRLEDIIYIESLRDYIKVVTVSGNIISNKTLTSMFEELPKPLFIKIHRSFIIALDKLDSIEGRSIHINKIRITIGRKYFSNAKNHIFSVSK